MKRFFSILFSIIIVTSLCLSSNAASWMIKENPTIVVPGATPTIDGNINSTEGWSSVAYLNEETATGSYGQNPLTSTVEFYFAFNNDGIFFAAEYKEVGAAYRIRVYNDAGMTDHEETYVDANAASYSFTEGGYPTTTPDGKPVNYYKIDANTTSAPAGVNPDRCFWDIFSGNGMTLCTGKDDIDNVAGFNGDVIGVNFDFLGEYDKEQFNSNDDYITQYNFGLFEDGSVKVARTFFDEAEITSECKTSGHKTDSGFVFEAFIPWDIIIQDANSCATQVGLEHTYTLDEIKAIGAEHRASVTLMDRFFDTEAGDIDTWGRFITACETTSYGMPGYTTSAINVGSYGLHLQMGSTSNTPQTDNSSNSSAVTTASANTHANSSNSTNSAQTFDAGIAIAVGAVAISGIGIFSIVKKKK